MTTLVDLRHWRIEAVSVRLDHPEAPCPAPEPFPLRSNRSGALILRLVAFSGRKAAPTLLENAPEPSAPAQLDEAEIIAFPRIMRALLHRPRKSLRRRRASAPADAIA
jgi:hypothetical protein